MTLESKFLLCLNEKKKIISKINHSIMDFHLQQIHCCETICITRMGTGKNYNAYTAIQC